MTDIATIPAGSVPTKSAAVADLQAYRRQRTERADAPQRSAALSRDAQDGWTLSAFHPFAACINLHPNLR